jgi:hypothetical protein
VTFQENSEVIENDERPIDAVSPTTSQRRFLERLMESTRKFARSKHYNDLTFFGHGNESYYCAYWTKTKRRFFVFGFERRRGVFYMGIPIEIDEPYRLARAWIADPKRKRAIIKIDEDPTEEMQLYFIEMGRRSIDYYYRGR